ncbi:threonine--tRNA ligase [Candidatus Parcubacteria bacterium 4484_255]|nr:MAG: threonine--tRNA ligase [Candidatus Parcubacteria bacterium 4484_255]
MRTSNNQPKMSIEILRHSCNHLMAAAVLSLFPKSKFGIGPTIENGFYYDIELSDNLSINDLSKIEKRMKMLIRQNIKFEKKEIAIEKAVKLFKKIKQPYKIKLLNDIKKYGTTKIKKRINNQTSKYTNSQVSIYQLGDFIDLCRGPHVESTKDLSKISFKLTKIAGAYWRGNEKNKMLTRIYGVAFEKQEELDKCLKDISEAEKRDHRKLGKKLDLFNVNDDIGPGLILWHPKGAIIKKIIEDYVINEYINNGYQLVSTPHIAKLNLWETSGHNNFYKENMFPAMHIKELSKDEKEDYQLKPMNCPFHIAIYKNKAKSYRDLPIKYTELGTVYRYEKSGVLHGLTRARGFTQDDAHIFCTPEQLNREVKATVQFAIKILKTFGFKKYDIYLSTQPQKFVGTTSNWEKSIQALKNALEKLKIKYKIDPAGGVFYGPKIDIKIKDNIGRAWQCTTIQVDFNLPRKFEMTYIDNKGKKKQPIMIHRALLGSLERFMGVLIEHYAGAFPVWLSPVQVYITPVGKAHRSAAKKIAQELKECGIRTETDLLNETVSYKIRKAEKQKTPYILVIGDKEMKGRYLNIRARGGKMEKLTKKQFIEKVLEEIKNKKS